MINVGHINTGFAVKAHGLDVAFDPVANEQFLTFKFALTASLPQLLQQLLDFQQTSEQQTSVPVAAPQVQFAPGAGEVGLQAQMLGQVPTLSSHMRVYGQQPGSLAPVGMPYMQTQPGAGPAVNLLAPLSVGAQQAPSLPSPQPAQSMLQEAAAALPTRPPPQPPSPLPGVLPNAPVQAAVPSTAGIAAASPQQAQQQQQPSPQHKPQVSPAAAAVAAPAAASLSAAPAANPQLNGAFVEALTASNLQLARQLINQRADVNCVVDGATKRTPLFQVLESGGKIDQVNLLLKAKANLNTVMSRGKTPLHVAIQQYTNIPPLVIRMLLCHKADLQIPDARGVTPLDCVRIIHMQCAEQGGRQKEDPAMRVRQLLNEVTEMPTLDVVIPAETQKIQNAFFADVRNHKIVFNTESSIGLYSLTNKKLLFFKKLKQQAASTVKNIAVNPEFGTIAVCIELAEVPGEQAPGRQNVFIVWPNGQLQDEEPLKLSIKIESAEKSRPESACVMLSHCQGPQMLLGRLVDGKVFCWHLNSARSQLVSEHELVKDGGRLAISDNGHWIAVCRNDTEPSGQVSVFTYETAEGTTRSKPVEVATLAKFPQAMAVQQTPDSGPACYLAIAGAAGADGALPPIEVISLSVDGSHKTLYRLKCPSICHTLSFCHRAATYLLSAHQDGLIILNDLLSGGTSFCHDSPGVSFLSVCSDRSMIVSAEDNYFRVFKVPAADA